MLENLRVYIFEIKGTTPLLHSMFRGKDEETRIVGMPPREQAEERRYLNDNREPIIPGTHVRGCLIEDMIRYAGKAAKKVRYEACPRIQVEPLFLPLKFDKYDVNTRAIKLNQGSKVTMSYVSQPQYSGWSTTGRIRTTLNEDMEKRLRHAGQNVGIGTNRVNGYGRFIVPSFKEIPVDEVT